jgi:hypothetical protein
MTPRLRLWVGLIVLFCAGALTGIIGTCLFMDRERAPRGERGPAAQHERIMKRLTQELSLTPQQQAEIEPIVSRAQIAILELRFSHQAEIEDIINRGMTELREKLASTQQPELDRMYKRLEQRWQVSREYLAAHKQGLTKQ